MIYLSNYPYLDSTVITFINNLITEDNFNEDKFKEFLIERAVASKGKPSAYLRVVFQDELEKGSFVKKAVGEKDGYNFIELYNYMRRNGIQVKSEDTIYIETFMTYLLTNDIIKIADLRHLNRNCVNYIKDNYKMPTSTIFIQIMSKSKSITSKEIDFDSIKEIYESKKEELEQLFQELKKHEKKEEDII